MTATIRIELDEVLTHFETLEDPRSTINQHHPLVSVVVISLMAALAGANGPTAISRWAKMKADWLEQFLPLPHGAPSKDCVRRVLMAIQPEAFQECFHVWLKALASQAAEVTGIKRPTINIDGKALRRSHDRKNGLGALHSVSAWASEYGLSLGQVATDAKSNEITAIPELLRLIDADGAVVTIDAMGTQTAIAEQIIEAGGDYVLALKGNQGTTYQSVVGHVNEQLGSDFEDVVCERLETTGRGHGRTELRQFIQLTVPDLPGLERWKGLATIGVVMLSCEREGQETFESRYFLNSLPMGVEHFAHAVRSHWSIENACHWTLDVTYREDDSRIRHARIRENFAWLNRFTLSLLKQHPGKQSIAMRRRSCGWSDAFLLEVLTGQAG